MQPERSLHGRDYEVSWLIDVEIFRRSQKWEAARYRWPVVRVRQRSTIVEVDAPGTRRRMMTLQPSLQTAHLTLCITRVASSVATTESVLVG